MAASCSSFVIQVTLAFSQGIPQGSVGILHGVAKRTLIAHLSADLPGVTVAGFLLPAPGEPHRVMQLNLCSKDKVLDCWSPRIDMFTCFFSRRSQSQI